VVKPILAKTVPQRHIMPEIPDELDFEVLRSDDTIWSTLVGGAHRIWR